MSDELKQVTHIDNVRLGDDEKSVVIIDQTQLPNRTVYLTLRTAQEVYDAIQAAKARHADVLLVDTAGRLHNKKNLMAELGKLNRIIEKEYPEAYRETLVVLDGTTGQNALAQAKEFKEVADITGIILTKLDGTAKGGIAVAIHSELGIPVKYIGVGESIDDLQKFDANQFVNALFNVSQDK